MRIRAAENWICNNLISVVTKMPDIAELKEDSQELERLAGCTKRQHVKDLLFSIKADIDKEIVTLEMKSRIAAERLATGTVNGKRYVTELTEYAWDQSAKFVKLFINLPNVHQLDESAVTVNFSKNSMNLSVVNLNNKDYALQINNLLEEIDVEQSYRKIKTGLIAIYLKKKKEDLQWDHLTTIHKRLKDKQDAEFKSDGDAPPEAALVNIMKKMYNNGDSQTKQMIAKAWTESQQKMFSGTGGLDMEP